MNRRDLLKAGLAAAALPGARLWSQPKFPADPFRLGVASGDPWPDSIVLWTRLAPAPLETAGGMPPMNVPVNWRIASDERMTRVVQKGSFLARPEWAHSVHIEVFGLQPDRWYWYQFDTGEGAARIESPVGCTHTMPAADSLPKRFPFAFVSCQKYETGHYTALEHLAEEDVSLAIHLGDYIYEKGPAAGARAMPLPTSVSLDQYRARCAFYKMDASLQKVHARFPWAVVSDDHEVANNYAGMIPEKADPHFAQRRAAAYHAYYEHMPLRASVRPHDAWMTLYRTLQVGRLAQFQMLDTRQYRTDQPCGDGTKPSCPEREGPSSMLGAEQEKWLLSRLNAKGPQWNVLAQQIIFSQIDVGAGAEHAYMMDKWDGYVAARRRVTDHIAGHNVPNVIILSGDNHNNWALDVKRDPDGERSRAIASEFAGTSITSGGDGHDLAPEFEPVLSRNPQVKFHNSQRGYVRCLITPEHWTTDFRIVPWITRPDAPIQTRASFLVEAGRAGMVRA